MNRDAAIAEIQEGLGFRSDLTDTIIAAMKSTQRLLERGQTLPEFMRATSQSLALTANTATVSLPSGFLRRVYTPLPYYVASGADDPTWITWSDLETAISVYGLSSVGDPAVFVVHGSSIRVFPTPRSDLTVTWDYYQKADTLDTNVENLWLANAPELIIGGAGILVARAIQNKAAEAHFEKIFGSARAIWLAETALADTLDQTLILGRNA